MFSVVLCCRCCCCCINFGNAYKHKKKNKRMSEANYGPKPSEAITFSIQFCTLALILKNVCWLNNNEASQHPQTNKQTCHTLSVCVETINKVTIYDFNNNNNNYRRHKLFIRTHSASVMMMMPMCQLTYQTHYIETNGNSSILCIQ